MNENALFIALKAALDAGFAAYGISPLPTVQDRYQATTQGINSGATVYLTNIGDEIFGYLKRTDKFDETSGTIIHNEEQPLITTFQFNATLIQNVATPSQLTAKDYLNYAKSILQSDFTREALRAQSIQVMRIKASRQMTWKDDKGRYERDPSFDCAFVHTSVITTVTPGTTKQVTNLFPIVVE